MADATDDDLIRRGDALAIFRPENSMARRRICDDIRAITAQVAQTLTIKPDLSDVRAMIDATEQRWQHLSYISATIRVNAMRHGATDAEIEAFIKGEADFVEWLSAKVAPQPAAQVQAEAVAVAYEAAAAVASSACLYGSDGGDPTEAERLVCEEAYNRIMRLIPADATAALARRDAETRKVALRAAAEAMKPMLRSMVSREWAHRTILALIEEPRHG